MKAETGIAIREIDATGNLLIMATVDFSKFISEIDRMGRGEISFDLGYLEELLEYDGIGNMELSLICSNCGSEGYTLECQFCGDILEDE